MLKAESFGPPKGYYASLHGTTGAVLRAALHSTIDNHQRFSYGDARYILPQLDCSQNSNGFITLTYSGICVPAKWDSGRTWNREHLWPKSRMDNNSSGPDYSDLFNLRPCNPRVNSARGNKYFDTGGSPVALAPSCRTDSDSWEPDDSEKGDIARAMMYMALRYDGQDKNTVDLRLAITPDQQSGKGVLGNLNALLAWHEADPISEEERRRNHLIYSKYQGNRNPFVDIPALVYEIYGSKLASHTPVITPTHAVRQTLYTPDKQYIASTYITEYFLAHKKRKPLYITAFVMRDINQIQ